MQNVGGGQYSFNNFKNRYDSVPGVKNLTQKFDKDGITLKTDANNSNQEITQKKKTSDIKQMAKRATAKRF